MKRTGKIIFWALCALIMLGSSRVNNNTYRIDRKEAKAAFELLNKIRQNPKAYSKETGANLDTVEAAPILTWNDTLARVAEARAMDMARRNYFGHVDPDGYAVNYYLNKAGYELERDWLKDKAANYFESCSAGPPGGEQAIESLILDSDWPKADHRKALLSMAAFDKKNKDIGIGFVICDQGCQYTTYMSVIIARHHW